MPSALRFLALLCLFASTSFHTAAADELAAQFSQPPVATKPRCYWYWMDGHISKEGATKDLEAMKRVGIGGAYIGIISGQSGAAANPEPKALTPQWWEFIEHSIREASRIGVRIGLFNSPGWSQSGGPWVTPNQAMRYVVQMETAVKGPQSFAAKLPAPQDNRHNTWFDASKPWIDYLRRCSVMLQTGHHVADVAYYIGEDSPKMTGARNPELPAGHDYDFINSEVIEKHLSVKDGRFVLPDGMSYRLLVLPESATMRPAVLKKIGQLVADGGAVLGPAPTRSPSLENFPAADEEVKSLAAEIWKDNKVMTGRNLTQALESLGVTPDVVVPAEVLWKHRADESTDIYFLSNARPSARSETISFRISDRTPELWWPESGEIQPIADYQFADGRLKVPVSFDPHGSVFVVFRTPRTSDERITPQNPGSLKIVKATYAAKDGSDSTDVTATLSAAIRNGRLDFAVENDPLGGDPAYLKEKQLTIEYTSAGKPGTITLPENTRLKLPVAPELTGPWNVSFPGRSLTFEKLIPWTEHPDADIKYFSGSATYVNKFQI